LERRNSERGPATYASKVLSRRYSCVEHAVEAHDLAEVPGHNLGADDGRHT
jgi:hypothetical protein